MTTTALAPAIWTIPVHDDFDDDLVHTVCDDCERALCDGGLCFGLEEEISPDDVECAVCEDLVAVVGETCPYCNTT